MITSFRLLSSLHDRGITRINDCVNFADDESICRGVEVLDYYRVQMKMIFVLPSKKDGIDDEDVPMEAIKKMNVIHKTAINKIPGVRIGPWLVNNKFTKESLIK